MHRWFPTAPPWRPQTRSPPSTPPKSPKRGCARGNKHAGTESSRDLRIPVLRFLNFVVLIVLAANVVPVVAVRAIELRCIVEYHANQLQIIEARQTLLESLHGRNSLPNNQQRSVHQSRP